MPSWNIHIAHAESLKQQVCFSEDAYRAFALGSLIPDIYVGYMVHDISCTYDYAFTHCADGSTIPLPDAQLFWDTYIVSSKSYSSNLMWLLLGTWAHLLTDRIYNAQTRAYITRMHLVPSEQIRIQKQQDFDVFGHTFYLTSDFLLTEQLIQEAQAFPQYPLLVSDLERTCEVAQGIVADTHARKNTFQTPYCLLDDAFFAQAFEQTEEELIARLSPYASQGITGTAVSS